jgi:hypothetical protein
VYDIKYNSMQLLPQNLTKYDVLQGSKRHFMYLILLGECSYVRKIGLNVMTHMPNSALITSREAHVRHRADNTVEVRYN